MGCFKLSYNCSDEYTIGISDSKCTSPYSFGFQGQERDDEIKEERSYLEVKA